MPEIEDFLHILRRLNAAELEATDTFLKSIGRELRAYALLRKVVLFLALFFVALTSGAAFAVWLDSSPFGLSPNFYAEKMQHAIRVFTIPLNTVAIMGVLFTLISTFLARHDRFSFYLLIAASACAIAATLITIFGNVPIINQIMTWNISSLPPNSMEVGEKWWWYQGLRVILTMAELSLLTLSRIVRA